MPSPFQKYQGEQIQPINILPYTAQIGETLSRGIEKFGENISKGLTAYKQDQEQKALLAADAEAAISKYLRINPEIDQNEPELSETAPSHIRDIYKKAQSQPDGLLGLASTDLMSFAKNNQQYKVEQQQDFENGLKTRAADLAQSQFELQEKQVKHQKKVTADNYQLAVKNYEWTVQSGKDRLEIDRANAQVQQALSAAKLALSPKEWELLDAQVKASVQQSRAAGLAVDKGQLDLDTAKSAAQAKQATLDAGYTVPRDEDKYIVVGRSGVYIDPDGNVVWAEDLDKELKDRGFTEDQVTKTTAPVVASSVSSSIAQKLSGDPKFNPDLDAVNNSSGRKKEFILGMYKAMLEFKPDKAAQIDKAFRWNPNTKTLNSDVELNTDTYNNAVKLLQSEDFQGWATKKYGITKGEAVVAPVPTKTVTVTWEGERYGTTRVIKNNFQYAMEVYEQARANWEEANPNNKNKFPMTWQDTSKALGIWGDWTPVVTGGGVMLQSPDGKQIIPEQQWLGMSNAANTPKSQWEMEGMRYSNFLRPYFRVTEKGIEGKTVGDFVIRYDVGVRSPDNLVAASPAVDLGKSQTDIMDVERALFTISTGMTSLKEMWKEQPMGEAFKPTSQWQKKYEATQRNVEAAFRKVLLAPGTETEKDADRLAIQMAAPDFILLLSDTKLAQEILDDTRAYLEGAAATRLSGYGMSVTPAKVNAQGQMTEAQFLEKWKHLEKIFPQLKNSVIPPAPPTPPTQPTK